MPVPRVACRVFDNLAISHWIDKKLGSTLGIRVKEVFPGIHLSPYYIDHSLLQGFDPVKRNQISTVPILLALSLIGSGGCDQNRDLVRAEQEYEQLATEYIEAWTGFYPTSAVRLGLDQHLAEAEARTRESVEGWIEFNELVLSRIAAAPSSLSIDLRIDLRLLKSQVSSELSEWAAEQPHIYSPSMYSGVLRGLVNVPATIKRIGGAELDQAMEGRIMAIPAVVDAMETQLQSGPESEVGRSIGALRGLLPVLETLPDRFPGLAAHVGPAADAVRSSISFLENEVEFVPEETDFPLGRDRYAEELQRYYDMEITPEDVADRALREIDTVRQLIAETSEQYWAEAHAGEPMPRDEVELVGLVSRDMEKNRPSTEQEALEAFSRFAEEAEAFVQDVGIATLPADRTLEIVLTPESAGPAQRIGFVDSAPPFDPDPMTLLSLPTIPDTYPSREKEDFYRSFNNHFNKFIIIHELFPGHYMQLKIASGNPRLIRTFFPYEPYVEGWATLVEKIALDAGWDDFNKLTYLAHLRKRLENANRAYTSVQVHCNGWTEEQVSRFSEEQALLAPQFAKSLWGRLERGPMQMTSYFMGKDMFVGLLEVEQDRLGEDFEVRAFTDAILNAGAVPVDMLSPLLVAAASNR